MIARAAAVFLAAVSGLAVCGTICSSAGPTTKIVLNIDQVGHLPAGFEAWRTGTGSTGRWEVVHDPTGVGGVAIQQHSTDEINNRFPLAAYQPIQTKNLELSARIKVISGRMQSAGIAFRVRNSENYYVVRMSALEERIDLFRVVEGNLSRIAGIEAPIAKNQWHTIAIIAVNEQYAIAIDNAVTFKAADRTFLDAGRVGLWTEEDNVTRFEEIEIAPLGDLQKK